MIVAIGLTASVIDKGRRLQGQITVTLQFWTIYSVY